MKSNYQVDTIYLTNTELVAFDFGGVRQFTAKSTDYVQISDNRNEIQVFISNGLVVTFGVTQITTIGYGSTTTTYTADPSLINYAASTGTGRKIDDIYKELTENVFKGCCRPTGPTIVGGLLVKYADLAALLASAPGSTDTLYLTEDTSLIYQWDGANFVLASGVQYYTNFASFPVTGEERVLYFDEAEKEMYVWLTSSYVSLCCDATQVIYKHFQVAHGFSVGDVIYVSANNTFAKAQADSLVTSYVAGFVIEASDPDTFRYVTHGTVTVGVPAVTGGTIMYLSETTAGALTSTAPTAPDIVRPVMMVVDNGNQGIVFLSLVDPAAGGGGGVASVTGDSVDNTDPANPVVNAIPLAGTTAGNPVTGDVEIADGNKIISTTPGSSELYLFFSDPQIEIKAADLTSLFRTILSIGTSNITVDSNEPTFQGINYAANYRSQFTTTSLVDLGYVKGFIWHANAAPTVNDDSGDEFEVDTLWIDYSVSPPELYVCEDATPTAAVWTQVGTGGSTSPAGSDTQVQFNDGGSFGADAGLTFDKTNNILSVNEAGAVTVNGVAITSHIRTAGNDGLSEVELEAHRHTNTAAAGASILWTRSRGTSASPTIVQDGDRIASITGAAYDGTDYATAAQIDFEVDGSPASNDMPGRIIFKTSPDGTQALTERMRINAAGNVIVTNDLDASNVTVDDEAYGVAWNGSVEVPTKNALYDKIETLAARETWSNGQGAATVAAGATEFGSLFGGQVTDSTTESARQSVVVSAGTMSRWYFRTSNAQPASGSLVLRSRINGANGNLIITIAAGSGAGTFSDLVNSDTVAAGDLVNYSAQNNASGASAQQLTTSNLFTFS
jgi:hypothetical protein